MPLSGKYFVETYGCQMNEHDSEKMCELMEQLGLESGDSVDNADVVIINTCAIRGKAEHKVHSSLGKLRNAKLKNPDMVIVVAGCVAQQQPYELSKKFHHLDMVLGTHNISELPEQVKKIRKKPPAGHQGRLFRGHPFSSHACPETRPETDMFLCNYHAGVFEFLRLLCSTLHKR